MNRYMSIDGVVAYEKYPFTKGQLLHLVAHRKKNGLYKAVCQIGRRIYLKEDLFDFWLDSHLHKDEVDPAQFIIKEKALIPMDAPIIKEKEGTICIHDKVDMPLNSFGLSKRTLNALNGINIKTLRDLTLVTEKKLLSTRNLDKKSVKEIQTLLKRFKLKFGALKGQYKQKGAK